jgi:TetR/AcrR family transcriptional regulator, regulator of cefoperazone and chloramphenicol sensitivity
MPTLGKAENDSATAQRLLGAAAREFAQHGFGATRIRDIVDAAGVNLAAVNYHFGGKEGLYRATLALLAKQALDDLPREGPEMQALPPEEQLRSFARAALVRYLGGEHAAPISRITAHELLDPTPACESMLRATSGPQWKRLLDIVAAMLGPRASEEDVALAGMSIAGQWVFFLFGRRLFEFQFPDIARQPALVDRLADHITVFSIAAIRAWRSRLEEGYGKPAHAPKRPVASGKRQPARGGRRSKGHV